MILYHAAGGGLGHLTRMRALLHTLAIDEPVTLLAPGRHGADRRVTGDVHYIPLDDELALDLPRYRRWLAETIEHVAPSRMIVDTFPAGILGELSGLPLPSDLQLELVARALRWDRYRPLLGQAPPRFIRSYIVETLPSEQQHYIEECSKELLKIELTDPPSDLSTEHLLASVGLQTGSFWLVVHSGPEAEIATLIAHAVDAAMTEGIAPPLLLISPHRPAGLDSAIRHLDIYPAAPLFPHAERIFTACGFNAMRQTRPWRDRHTCVPFPRRYDDQKSRSREVQESGSQMRGGPWDR